MKQFSIFLKKTNIIFDSGTFLSAFLHIFIAQYPLEGGLSSFRNLKKHILLK